MTSRAYDTRIDRAQGSLRHAILAMAASLVLFANTWTGLLVSTDGGLAGALARSLCRPDAPQRDTNGDPPDRTPAADRPHCLFCLPLLQGGLAPAGGPTGEPPTVVTTARAPAIAGSPWARANAVGGHAPRGPPVLA
ncbi:MAG: hypothetical protein LCH95_10255 [Proteobacteria bacterium]|nr:hypothetical protein [Pseudomonadota bacterium]